MLEYLRRHQLFLKAEKCLFHQHSVQFLGYNIDKHGIQMDEGKVEAVHSWPIPKTIKDLQHVLGFAIFYQIFIRDYSTIAVPLTSLLMKGPKTLRWNDKASAAFTKLKLAFISAPILVHPSPELSFVMEVDASTTGVGAVLSQQGIPEKLNPCAFFSRKLSQAERNYDIRELLAVKLAIEEWRH